MIGSSLIHTLKFSPTRSDTTLILSLPSSLEKEFSKIPYSKGISFLIKKKKVDYCLIFVVNKQKLKQTLEEIHHCIKDDCMLWIAFPKRTSKIITNLKINDYWEFMQILGYCKVTYVIMDNVWSAVRFMKVSKTSLEQIKKQKQLVDISAYIDESTGMTKVLHPLLEKAFEEDTIAYEFFKTLSFDNKKNYLIWIHLVVKEIILKKRILDATTKMTQGILDPFFDCSQR